MAQHDSAVAPAPDEGRRTDLLRRIPRIDALLAEPPLVAACECLPYEQVRTAARERVGELRAAVLAGETDEVPDTASVAREVADDLVARGRFHLRRVVNATGVVLHTNLGRAPLGEAVADHVADVACGYANIEYDVEAGRRGSRYDHVEELLRDVTGAESALVVNNNAAAVFLMLDTLCRGQGVAISRGELVEIGGSFRVPDIMARSGAELVEVGTTNKTHPADYERALDAGAAALLKVHQSNFYQRGFTESVALRDLAGLAREREVAAGQEVPAGRPLVLYDAGAAFLSPELMPPAIATDQADELTVRGALRAGADLVCFSADKLMGSAQAGVVVGRRDLVARLRRNPLCRMVRIDKLSLAALEMTLQLSQGARAQEDVPALRMMSLGQDECRARARRLAGRLAEACPDALSCEVVDLVDEVGGGSLPDVELPGAGVVLELPGLTADELARSLRAQPRPVVALVRDGRVVVSVRTLVGDDEDVLAAEVADVCAGAAR